ncbi:MAG: methyltransferase, partial [Proteobacteria bacterium]|nr:methyltransferase [Pseudomonadota bacterium]
MENPSEFFFTLLAESLTRNTFSKLVLGKYHGPEVGLNRVFIRRLTLRKEECLSFVYRYQTKDITKNLPLAAALVTIRDLIATAFNNAHLQTVSEDIQLTVNKKGKYTLLRGKAA